jgi:hypothetical protein
MNHGGTPGSKPAILTGILSTGPATLVAMGEYVKAASPETGLALQFIGGMLASFVGFATNRLASAQDRAEEAVPLNASEVGINHHLARLAGHALATIIEEESQRHAEGTPERLALEEAARRTEEAWLIVLQSPSAEELRRLSSSRLADAAAGQATAPDGVLVLEAKLWLPFARFVLTGPKAALPLPPASRIPSPGASRRTSVATSSSTRNQARTRTRPPSPPCSSSSSASSASPSANTAPSSRA